jgi:serine protease Do
MMTRKKAVFLFLLFGVVGIIIGIVLSSSLNWSNKSFAEAKEGTLSLADYPPINSSAGNDPSPLFTRVAKIVTPAVVTLYTEKVVKAPAISPFFESPFDEFFRRFFEPPSGEFRQRALGSGVIVTRDGYILTNNHVVEGAEKITVTLIDDRQFNARLVGRDPRTDVAVIKIEGKNLPAAKLGDSEKIEIGQWVLAIGSPFSKELKNTVTAGIISAKGRSNVGLAQYEDFIQTDAAINPGNSGGALVNMQAEVIGINTAIETRTGVSAGIGLAIPVNMAEAVMKQLIEKGKVVRGYLGVTIQPIDATMAKALGLSKPGGAIISSVVPGSPADKAGLKRGDIILEMEGKPVKNATDLSTKVAESAPGSKVAFTVLRKEKEITITALLAELESEEAEVKPSPEATYELGMNVQTLTPDLARRLGYAGEKGVLVTEVRPGSIAYYQGLKRGDLIKEINRTPISSFRDYQRIMRNVKPGDTILMLIRRGDSTVYLALELPDK